MFEFLLPRHSRNLRKFNLLKGWEIRKFIYQDSYKVLDPQNASVCASELTVSSYPAGPSQSLNSRRKQKNRIDRIVYNMS